MAKTKLFQDLSVRDHHRYIKKIIKKNELAVGRMTVVAVKTNDRSPQVSEIRG